MVILWHTCIGKSLFVACVYVCVVVGWLMCGMGELFDAGSFTVLYTVKRSSFRVMQAHELISMLSNCEGATINICQSVAYVYLAYHIV